MKIHLIYILMKAEVARLIENQIKVETKDKLKNQVNEPYTTFTILCQIVLQALWIFHYKQRWVKLLYAAIEKLIP